jgi:hypothetical protein
MPLATRYLTVTQGNLNNNHLYLTDVLDLFPPDVVGGANNSQPAPRQLLIVCDHQTIATDITGDKNIFRQRAWIGRFFRDHDVRPGDLVRLEQLEPYLYRVSALSDEPDPSPVPVAAAERVVPPPHTPASTHAGSVLDYDTDRVEDAVLALLYLNLFLAPDGTRAALAHPRDVIDRLHRKGYLGDPAAAPHSVPVTAAGLARAEALFRSLFGRDTPGSGPL